jgi:hypothetical protein
MELKTWKTLFSVSLTSGLLGCYLLLFNLVLSMFLSVVGVVGLMLLTWNRWKIIVGRHSWLYLVSLKRRGKLPKNLEQEKMPSWLFAWIVFALTLIWISALFLLESEFWYISFFLFYIYITSAVLIAFYSEVIKH